MLKFIETSRFDRLGVFPYSHEENTHSHSFADDISDETKQERVATIMELQEGISLELNQKKIGKVFKVLIDRKEEGNFIGRTEFDSPEVDNEVIINAEKDYLRIGDFAQAKVIAATEFDLHAEVIDSH
jgi:ribosomal protein S12 methylthiotransferase